MLLIYITLIAMLAMAKARPRRRRRMGRYIRGGVDELLSLGTLNATTLIGVLFDETVDERTLVTSVVATYTLSDVAQAANRGPVMIGVAHGDYSDAEIEAFIEMTDSWDEGNLVEQEIAKRRIRRVCTLQTASATEQVVANDGKPIKTKLNWILLQGQTLRLWAYNMGTADLLAGAVRLQGHVNLFPK